jgi:hypothetical protein
MPVASSTASSSSASAPPTGRRRGSSPAAPAVARHTTAARRARGRTGDPTGRSVAGEQEDLLKQHGARPMSVDAYLVSTHLECPWGNLVLRARTPRSPLRAFAHRPLQARRVCRCSASSCTAVSVPPERSPWLLSGPPPALLYKRLLTTAHHESDSEAPARTAQSPWNGGPQDALHRGKCFSIIHHEPPDRPQQVVAQAVHRRVAAA